MVIKMCGNDIAVYIIGRMLHRRKFLDLLTHGQYDDSSRMLARSTTDAGATLHNTVDLTVTLVLSPLFIIILHITKCGLFRKGTNGSCLECLAFSEDNLRIPVSIGLVFSGKVQVDIRLLISFETKECLKRDIKSFFVHLGATFRADLIRHVTPCHTCVFFYLRRIKIAVFTVRIRTEIMRRQRIYLRDTGHSRCQGRTYRTSGTYQITILIGFPYQFLCNDIHHRITIGDNGVQLPVQTVLHDLRKRISVHFVGFCETDILKILLGVFNDRRKFIRMDRRDLLDHIRDLVGIGNDHFFCFFTSQIGKFLQHFLRCTKVKRCLVICIGKSVSCHDNPAVNLILRIHEMHIAGGNYRLFELFAKFYDLPVYLF